MQCASAASFLDQESPTGKGYASLMRYVDYAAPLIVTAENVAALGHVRKQFDSEKPIQIQDEAFARRGYHGVHEKVTSTSFGLAQTRSRVWAIYQKSPALPMYLGSF